MLDALRDDALTSTADGFELHLSLPWIRSLPLSALTELAVSIDGQSAPVQVVIGDRVIAPADLAAEQGWWFVQDRLALRGARRLTPGAHDVDVAFGLVIPYLQAGPDGPLRLPFHFARTLSLDTASPTSAWTLGASAFNWTPEVIRADAAATDIAVGIVSTGVARVIEVELGQLWRSFPSSSDAEATALRESLAAVGGQVSIVGASIDDWATPTRRRTAEERLAFLLPQLHSARRLGARGIRLPIGQTGPALLDRLLPVLHELDLILFEEAQGPQTPTSPAHREAYETVARLDDPRVRLLIDISMLMPALPVTYLDRLRTSGLPAAFIDRLTTDWRDPATSDAVVALLRSGSVPPPAHTLVMNLLVRFGRSDAADLRDVLPLVGGAHLKFWDLDDADDRISRPIREFGAELRAADFAGPLTSEWGGHEWLDDDPTAMTRGHLELARTALAP